MASPGSVVIQFLAKTSESVRDIAKLGRSLDQLDNSADDVDRTLTDTQRAIDKTGDTATTTGRDLDKAETGLDGLGDEAERTADRLRRSAQDMATGIKSGTDRIEHDTDGVRGHMREAGAEAGSEFISNIAEGIGSGQANLNDVVQGTLGGITNLAASFGPVGAAAAGVAAGVGLVFQAVKGQSEKAKARVQELAEALDELGDTSSIAAQKIVFETWLTRMKETPDVLAKIVGGLTEAGVTQEEWQAAISGNETAQERVRKKVQETGIEYIKMQQNGKPLTKQQEDYLKNSGLILGEIRDINQDLEGTKDLQDDVNWLTGEAEKNANAWADEQNRVYNETHNIKNELNKIPSTIPVNVIVTRKDRNGNPSKLGPGQLAADTVGVSAAAAAPVNVTVYAQASTIPDTPRALIALLEGHNVRMGRQPRQPRAVAW